MTPLEHLKTSSNFLGHRAWSDSSQVVYLKDNFDSDRLSRSCAKIELRASASENIPVSDIIEDLKKYGVEYATVRLPASHFFLVPALSIANFLPVDSIIEFSKIPNHNDLSPSIRKCTPDDSPNIEELAAHSFSQSRFHNDPLIEKKTANEIYRIWARNIVSGEVADACHVAVSEDSDFAGFISIASKISFSEIGLIAMDSSHSGKGLGKQLVQSAEVWTRDKNLSEIRVKTQSFNLPAISLYQSCGFKIFETYTTLRWVHG